MLITPVLIDAICVSESWGGDGGGGTEMGPTLGPLEIGREKWVVELCEMVGIDDGGGIMAAGFLPSPVFLRFIAMSTGISSDRSRFRGALGLETRGGIEFN